MAKKGFGGDIQKFYSDKPKGSDAKEPGSAPKAAPGRVKSSKVGTKANETRFTFIVDESDLEAVKALAHFHSTQIKDVLGVAIKNHLASKKSEVTKALDAYRKKKPYS